jgi:hypothetical protein
MALSVAAGLEWHNRKPEEFIDQIVKSARIVNDFTLVDGVKSKVALPIYGATLSFGSDLCTFDPQSAAEIDEKEMSVSTFKWDFVNCKNVLESEYRSMMLRQGQLNEEVMDADFADWVFDYFAKLVGSKVLAEAGTQLVDAIENGADAASVNTDTISAIDESNILAALETGYKAMPADVLAAVYGDADRSFLPTIYLGTAAFQAYQLAIADKYTQTPEGIIRGEIPTYLGMPVVHFASLPANTVIMTPPRNLVMLTDDFADTTAIQNEYEARVNSLYVWGQFKLGFDFKNPAHIVYLKTA